MTAVVFEAVRSKHAKLLVEKGLPHEFVFDEKAFETFDEFQMLKTFEVVEYECELDHIPGPHPAGLHDMSARQRDVAAPRLTPEM